MAPYIAVPIPSQSITQTASAVTVIAKAVTGNTTEAAAKVIAAVGKATGGVIRT